MPRKKKPRKKTVKNVQHKKKLSKRRTGKSKLNAKTIAKPSTKISDFKMMSYQSQYSNVDGKVNRMERKVVSDKEKTNIWEMKNDKVTKKTIRHKKSKVKKPKKSKTPKILSKKLTPSKVELKKLMPLSSFELPHLIEKDPFYDFVYSPNIFKY